MPMTKEEVMALFTRFEEAIEKGKSPIYSSMKLAR
jgi:hypothetical protein